MSALFCFQCGDEHENETIMVFGAETPLSTRHSVAIPLGKKHSIATIDVLQDTEILARVCLVL